TATTATTWRIAARRSARRRVRVDARRAVREDAAGPTHATGQQEHDAAARAACAAVRVVGIPRATAAAEEDTVARIVVERVSAETATLASEIATPAAHAVAAEARA